MILILILLTIFIHELGHVVAARMYGWKFKGVKIKWYGPNVKMLGPENAVENMWKIALGGPAASFLLAFIFLMLSPLAPIFLFMFYFGLIVTVANLIPIPKSDGMMMWKSLRNDVEEFKVCSLHPNETRSET
jgi:stage IV sporulation protein FB